VYTDFHFVLNEKVSFKETSGHLVRQKVHFFGARFLPMLLQDADFYSVTFTRLTAFLEIPVLEM